MSDSTVHNLLMGTSGVVHTSADYLVARYKTTEPLVVGRTYTVSAYVEEVSRSGSNRPVLTVYDGAGWYTPGVLYGDVPGQMHLTFIYHQPFPDHTDPNLLDIYNTPPDGTGVTRVASIRNVMLVEGTTPAAWAPAEGESLAGGGALMSANLWDASTANIRPDADGVYTESKDGTVSLKSAISGLAALAENQTVHMSASLRGANGKLKPYVKYRDAAGHYNSVGYQDFVPTDEWVRLEQSCVVPSGMTIVEVGFYNKYATGDIEVANPVFCYGSPVTLASDAHTPYATQDHLAAEYATKAALKVTSDAVTAEVTERGKLAGRVGTLESTFADPAASRRALGIATVADVAWTDLWKDTSGNYVRWACRNNVVYVTWKIPQATADPWKAGILPAGYRPSGGTATVAAWTEGNRMATGWVNTSGDVYLKVNSAQTDGTNQGSLSYPIF